MAPFFRGDSLEYDPVQGNAVSFDASGCKDVSCNDCAEFEWDFGDGTPAVTTREPPIDHVFVGHGAYPVSLRVTDASGNRGVGALNQRVCALSTEHADG